MASRRSVLKKTNKPFISSCSWWLTPRSLLDLSLAADFQSDSHRTHQEQTVMPEEFVKGDTWDCMPTEHVWDL